MTDKPLDPDAVLRLAAEVEAKGAPEVHPQLGATLAQGQEEFDPEDRLVDLPDDPAPEPQTKTYCESCGGIGEHQIDCPEARVAPPAAAPEEPADAPPEPPGTHDALELPGLVAQLSALALRRVIRWLDPFAGAPAWAVSDIPGIAKQGEQGTVIDSVLAFDRVLLRVRFRRGIAVGHVGASMQLTAWVAP